MFPTRKPGLPALFFTTVFVFSVAPVNDTRAGIPADSIAIGSDNFTNDTLTGEPDRHYHLVEEIDLGQGQWSPPLWFNASLDGRGYGIHNLSLNNTDGPAALFHNVSGSIFNNLKLVNFNITGRPGSALANHMEYVRVMGLRVLGGWIRGAGGVDRMISLNSTGTDGQPGGGAYGIGETFHHSILANAWINSTIMAGSGGNGENSVNHNGGGGGKGADASGLFRQAVNSTFYDNRVLSDVSAGPGGHGGVGYGYFGGRSHGGKGGEGGTVNGALLESRHCYWAGFYFNGSRLSGEGGNGNLGTNAPGGDGADGGAVIGFVMKDTGSTHRDLQVAGHLTSGSGGFGYFGGGKSGQSGRGGDVFGLMAQADGVSLRHVRILARLVSGDGGNLPSGYTAVGVSGNSGGTVTSMIGQSANVVMENVWSGGSLLAGYGSSGGPAATDRNAGLSGKGGSTSLLAQTTDDIKVNGLLVTGMMQSGDGAIGAEGNNSPYQPSAPGGDGGDAVIIQQSQGLNLTDALVAGSLISGNGAKGGLGHSLYPSADGGDGGDIHLWGNASDTWLSRVLLTASLTVGAGGSRGDAVRKFGNNGTVGTLTLNLTGPGNQLQDFLYDTNRTGVSSFPGGNTTSVLQMLSTYTGWEGWRVIAGKYPFPTRLDNLLLNLDPAEYGLDCAQYACSEASDYCQLLPAARGSLQQVIEINNQLYGLVQKDNGGLYWIRLAQNGTLPLTAQCGIMPFYGESTYAPVTGNASAALNDNGRIFVAWRQSAPFAEELTGKAQSYIGEYQLAAGIPRKTPNASSAWLPAPVVALLSDNDHLYAVISDAVYRITRDRLYEQTPIYHIAPGQPGQFRGAALLGQTLYLLTQDQDSYTLSAVNKDSGQPVNGFTPVNLDYTSKNTYLSLPGNRLHIL